VRGGVDSTHVLPTPDVKLLPPILERLVPTSGSFVVGQKTPKAVQPTNRSIGAATRPDLCDQFNVTADLRLRGPKLKVSNLMYTGRPSAKTHRLYSATT
jgi:hypothetical protein